MFDTPVTKHGETKTDGWYGEDVGADGLFGDLTKDTFCWWLGREYAGADAGECDFDLTDIIPAVTDIYGNTAGSEDELLPFGRMTADETYGITGDPVTGEGYGYMVRYDRLGQSIDQGAWVRNGYDNGRLDPGDGVPDFTGPPPPPSPKIKVSSLGNDITVEWSSHEFGYSDGTASINGPEHTIDRFTRRNDFEGYQVLISPDIFSQNYSTVFSVDKINYVYEDARVPNSYLDHPFDSDDPSSLPEIITSGDRDYQLRPYGDNRDIRSNHSSKDLYTYTCVRDSVEVQFSPDSADFVGVFRYKFVLHNKLLAKQYFVSVTSSDHGDPKTGVPALQSSPSVNGAPVVTSTFGKAGQIVVVPNPYRGDVDYSASGWEGAATGDEWKEQDRRIAFLNIPDRCVIKIYTLAGDLVKTIGHNGNARYSDPYVYGTNGAWWNLINDNNQAVVSGIYLFSVQDADKEQDDFVGKFVIIK
jgi:hypothetical protein